MMKKSISYWAFPGGLDASKPVVEACKEAKAAGFEAIELAFSVAGEISLDSTTDDLKRLRKSIEETKIEIASLACALGFQWQFTSDDPEVRAKAVEVHRKAIAAANALGTDALLVVPGAVDVPWDPSVPVVRYGDAYKRASEEISKLIRDAENASVVLCVENVWNKFLLSPMEMAAFVDQLNSPCAAVYFDVGNCVYIGYPQDWIRVLGKRIKRVHLKDFRRSVGTVAGFVDLLSGDVDWPAVIEALKEIGYEGPLTAEMIPPYTHYPEVLIANTSRALDAILGRCV
ncbi:MAG: sugar phosphate isomerase/epimerase family protein [Armatimonadota bacterium]|nr:sugar phosphate isomerase/epimerase family protein [Armatimonadota bacterium]